MRASLEHLKALMTIAANASKNDINNRFQDIAKILQEEAVIKFNNAEYRIVDFEFYFYNKNHQDISVHPRISKALCWYINDFGGIDLNFESKIDRDPEQYFKYWLTDNSFFGGVLIRQIQRVSDGMIFDGPLKVAELFRHIDATTHQQNTPIIEITKTKLSKIEFEAIYRYNLLGSRKCNDLDEKIKKKVDYNIKQCFTRCDASQDLLETELKIFLKLPYRYRWVKP